jgi:hypothetical protein
MIVGSILIEHDPARDGDVNSCCFITPPQAVKSTYDTAPVRCLPPGAGLADKRLDLDAEQPGGRIARSQAVMRTPRGDEVQ